MSLSIQVVFACLDPNRLAEFWAEALGYIVQPPPEGFERPTDRRRRAPAASR
ncbi:MAG: VOC family protein [Acidimicrobiia bacterium]